MSKGGDPKIPETEEEKELARIGIEDRLYFDDVLKPVRNQYIAKALDSNSTELYDTLKGDLQSATAVEFDRATAGTSTNLAAGGVDASSGKFKGTMAKMGEASGLATADSVNRGQSMQQDNYLTNLSNVVAIGEGQETKAVQGLADVANIASSKARTQAQTEMQNSALVEDAAGTLAGIGYGIGG